MTDAPRPPGSVRGNHCLVHLTRVIRRGADVTAADCERCGRWWKCDRGRGRLVI